MPERGREPIAVVATIERYELCCLMQESGCGLVAVVERSETRDCRFAYHARWSLGEFGRDFETYIVSCAERARANGRFACKHVISTLDCR